VLPVSSVTRAFAGVFDPRPGHAFETLRARLELALEPDGAARRIEDGPLALAWTSADSPGIAETDRTFCLLDGHVYNLGELTDAVRPATAATLVGLYELLGPALLPRLRGDFALLFWDRLTHTGLLARDQLGARPLHLHMGGGCLAFASETRNLTRLLPASPAPDETALCEWLCAGAPSGDSTLFRGIRTLAPATCVELTADGASAPRRYWAPRYRAPDPISADEASHAVRESVFRAVKRRADEGPNTGVLLSGGIDSASVAATAATVLGDASRPRRAYTVTFPLHPEIDEAGLTATVASATGFTATSLQLRSGSVLGGGLEYMDAWRVPPSSPNLFFLRPILERAREDGLRVLLDGEGGDALFWYAPEVLADRLRGGRLLTAWHLAGQFPEYGVPTSARIRLNRLRTWGKSSRTDGAPRWWRAVADAILGPGSLLLHDVSRRHGALAGLEPRHPLLDLDLIELALRLPPEMAFDRRYNRPVLRRAMQGLVPDEVRLRPYKSRFDPVFAEGISRDLPAIERLLPDPRAEIRAYVDAAVPQALLRSRPTGPFERRAWATQLWQLTIAECWLRSLAGMPALPDDAHRTLEPTNAELCLL
jgi:asparagine synthase (glutamine-hydrolysing)